MDWFRFFVTGAFTLGLASTLNAQSPVPEFAEGPRQLGPNSWRLSWKSEEGANYRLERSIDLKHWDPVESLTALGTTSFLVDDELTGQDKVFWRVVPLEDNGTVTPLRITQLSPDPGNPEDWQLTWTSEAGVLYRLEHSFDLLGWDPVGTVTGLPDFTSMFDRDIAGRSPVYWRVTVAGTGEPLVVGDLTVTDFQVNGANSTMSLQIIVGGTETVTEVIIFDGQTELGPAQPGFGSSWNFPLDWDATAPARRDLVAEVRTQEGSVEQTSVRRLLLADPAKFVPLDAAGALLYGEFVSIDEDGDLAPFQFFPEGFGDPATLTGAHFAFRAGASIVAPAPPGDGFAIRFSEGRFHRGHTDPSPVSVSNPGSTIDLGHVTPAAVASAFQLPADGVELCWGDRCVSWESGSLGVNGWGDLRIDLGLGDFALPTGRLNPVVTRDPVTGKDYLVACCFGTWAPLQGMTFAIPQEDPLKIYLSRGGEFSAHGTAEASFANGAEVRGSLSWRSPHFEFRFEGKGITIPSLDRLRGLLPSDPESAIPPGSSAAELNSFAEVLQAYLDINRGLAMGGSSHADPSAPASSLALLPAPTDPAQATLAAWASRIASWQTDRAGQRLGAEESREVGMILEQGRKFAAAANDLPSALLVLKSLVRMRPGLADVIDPSELDAVGDRFEKALLAATASCKRIIAARPEYEPDEHLRAAVETISEIVDWLPAAPAPPPGGSGDPVSDPPSDEEEEPPAASDERLRGNVLNIISASRYAVPLRLFTDTAIVSGDTRPDNPVLSNFGLPQLFEFLRKVELVFDVLAEDAGMRAKAEGTSIGAFKAIENPYPELPVYEALRQCEPFLFARLNEKAARALGRKDAVLAGEVLAERARVFALYKKFGVGDPLLPGSELLRSDTLLFAPVLGSYLQEYMAYLEPFLSTHTADARAGQVANFITSLATIAESVADDASFAVTVEFALDWLKGVNDRVASLLAGDPLCNQLVLDLKARGHSVLNASLGYEGSHVPPISGKYESVAGAGRLRTLQINQGGRFLTANLQIHSGGRPLQRQLIRGMLSRELDDRVEYAYLLVNPQTQRIITSGTLAAISVDGTVEVVASDKTGGTNRFRRVSIFPAYSDQVGSLFTGEARELFDVQQRSPAHFDEVKRIVTAAELVKKHIRDYLRVYNRVTTTAAETDVAKDLERTVAALRDTIATEHGPLVRLLFRIHHSKSFPSVDAPMHNEAPLEDHDLFYRTWLLMIFNSHRAIMPETGDVLGLVPNVPDESELYTYEGTVRMLVAAADIPGTPVSVGDILMEADIRKTMPDGTQPPLIRLKGELGQVGVGVGLEASATISNDTFTFKSPFDYQPDDFAGFVSTAGAGGSIIVGAGAEFRLGEVVFFGSGRFPSVTYTPSFASGSFGIGVGLGIDMGFGLLVARTAYEGSDRFSLDDQFNPKQATFDSAVGFEVDSAVLNPCGWQSLREFAAEFRAMFASPSARVLIIGTTDTTASESHNLQLSQERADAVRTALLEILGPFDVVPDTRVEPYGLGERAAREDIPIASFPEGPVRTVVEFLRLNNTIADGTKDAEWRRVTIIVNDLVSAKVSNPSDLNPKP